MGLGGPPRRTLGEILWMQTGISIYTILLPGVWAVIPFLGIKDLILRKASFRSYFNNTIDRYLISIVWPLILSFENTGLLQEKYYQLRSYLASERPRKPTTEEISDGISGEDRAYEYRPLRGDEEIRLLVIYPGSFDDPILVNVVLANFLLWTPKYTALSYTWADESGHTETSQEIRVVNDGSILRVTKNCEAAIRRLRSTEQERRVWIDAICIDQQSNRERTHQVSLMSRIYVSAQEVVAYTGEATPGTDKLFNWLNALDMSESSIPSFWQELDKQSTSAPKMTWAQFSLWGSMSRHQGAHWLAQNVEDRERQSLLVPPQTMADSELSDLISEYSSRRWFRRVWVLQEVSLPELHRTKVMCGAKTTSALRALHAISLVQSAGASNLIRIFYLLYQRNPNIGASPLLDVLIETRDREAADPRDKIFGVLSISRGISVAMGLRWDYSQPYKGGPDYSRDTVSVYAQYSEFFIATHGAGFFWSLIKHPPALEDLPSWSADWTVPWPNYKAVAGRDFPAASRHATAGVSSVHPAWVDQHRVLTVLKSRIMKGYFTRNGHLDDSDSMKTEDVASLPDDKVLVEMYPGLAVLLRKQADHYVVIQTCPHAINKDALAAVVECWSNVVVDGNTPEERTWTPAESESYLSPPVEFCIW